MKVKSENEVAQSCPTLATPRTAAYQAPLSKGSSRQEYWSGVPLPSPKQFAFLPKQANLIQPESIQDGQWEGGTVLFWDQPNRKQAAL